MTFQNPFGNSLPSGLVLLLAICMVPDVLLYVVQILTGNWMGRFPGEVVVAAQQQVWMNFGLVLVIWALWNSRPSRSVWIWTRCLWWWFVAHIAVVPAVILVMGYLQAFGTETFLEKFYSLAGQYQYNGSLWEHIFGICLRLVFLVSAISVWKGLFPASILPRESDQEENREGKIPS